MNRWSFVQPRNCTGDKSSRVTVIPSAARNLSSTPKGRISIVAHEPPIVRSLAPLGMTRNEL